MKISYILPCYNVGRFITDTLGSIYAQGMAEEDFEVICVNDCSTDDTHDIISEIQSLHTNLILIDQPTNRYSGAARNRGLDIARGEYIWFIDSDDMIKPNCVGELLEILERNHLDILLFNFDEFNDGNPDRFIEQDNLFDDSEVLQGDEFVMKKFDGNLRLLSLLWVRIVRRSLIEDYAIRFPDLYISQDCPFAWESLLRANRVQSISGRYYNYRANAGSITANKNTAKKATVWSFLFPKEIARIIDVFNGIVPNKITTELEKSIQYEVNHFGFRYNALPNSEKPLFFTFLRQQSAWYHQFHGLLSFKNRMLFQSSRLGEYFFRFFSRIIS